MLVTAIMKLREPREERALRHFVAFSAVVGPSSALHGLGVSWPPGGTEQAPAF